MSNTKKKKRITAKMPKLTFEPEVTPYLRKIITDAIRDKYNGKTRKTTVEEIMRVARSLEQ